FSQEHFSSLISHCIQTYFLPVPALELIEKLYLQPIVLRSSNGDHGLLAFRFLNALPMLKSIDRMSSKSLPILTLDPPKTAPKVGFVSLGCPKNLVDSEVMMGMLAQAGAELVPNAEDADVIVVNTCSFIESAQQESVNTILEMARHKTGGT